MSLKTKQKRRASLALTCAFIVAFSSCGKNHAKEFAADGCSCLKQESVSMLTEGSDPSQIQHAKCIGDISARLKTHLTNLSDQERKRFTRELVKAFADTDCADMLLNFVPYEEVISSLEELEN